MFKAHRLCVSLNSSLECNSEFFFFLKKNPDVSKQFGPSRNEERRCSNLGPTQSRISPSILSLRREAIRDMSTDAGEVGHGVDAQRQGEPYALNTEP